MSAKNSNHDEMPAELMDALRRGYNNDRTAAAEVCPVSANAVAYAFEELAPQEHQKVEDHLQSCRACMQLILDARAADVESQAHAGQPAEILPALSDAINRPQKPSFIEKLAAGFRMPSIAPKIIATAAVACIVVPVTYYVLKNPATVEKLPVVRKQIASSQIAEKKQKDQPANTSPEKSSSINSISNYEDWSANPFEPIYGDNPRPGTASKKRARRTPRTPLEKLDLSQLKLVGVMLSDKGNTALVEDASGKGYVIKEGTYVGVNSGKVVQILKDRFIIEEEIEDIHGKTIRRKREIKLLKP